MYESSKILTKSGYPDDQDRGGGQQPAEGQDVDLTKGEARAYHILAARLNYMAQDSPLDDAVTIEGGLQMDGKPSVAGLCKNQEVGATPQGLGPGEVGVPVAFREGGVEAPGDCGQRLGGVS